jgi:hypothetical protein
LEFFDFVPLSLPLLLNDIQILLGSFVEYRFGSLASTGIRRSIFHRGNPGWWLMCTARISPKFGVPWSQMASGL